MGRKKQEDLIVMGADSGNIYNVISAKDVKKKKWKDRNPKYEKYGPFYWLKDIMFSNLTKNLSESDFVKLVYLATYMGYDEKFAVYNNGYLITRENLKDVLRLKDKKDSDRFLKRIIDAKLVALGGDGTIYFNRNVFWRGKLKKSQYGDMSRVYIDAVRKLYLETPFRSHKKLAKFFRLIPYIHKDYGMLCKKVNELDPYKAETLTTKELCEIMQCSYNNASKTIKEICSVRLDGSPIMMYVTSGVMEKTHILVNPKIFYSGDYDKYIDVLNYFFGNEKQQKNNESTT